jgi:hypothetical protein
MIINLKSNLFIFLDSIPQIIIIAFWIILILKYLKGFNISKTNLQAITRKFVIRLSILTIVLFALLIGIRYLENIMWNYTQFKYEPGLNLIIKSRSMLTILNFIEVVVIAIGLFRVLKINYSITDNQQI